MNDGRAVPSVWITIKIISLKVERPSYQLLHGVLVRHVVEFSDGIAIFPSIIGVACTREPGWESCHWNVVRSCFI
jgi:hypothetical protein